MNGRTFELFGTTHLSTLGIILLVSIVCVAIGRRESLKSVAITIGWVLAGILLVNEASYLVGSMLKGTWDYRWGLPLHLCDLTIILVAVCLIKHNQWLWELAYFWGLGGTLHALITPDIDVSFPDYRYIKFFVTHGCIVIGVIFLAVGLKRRIDFSSVKNVFVVTNAYMIFIAALNYLLGSNYLYLCAKPSQASLIDHLGPWPWYILSLEGVFIVTILVLYVPFALKRKIASEVV